jgi:hypothetical protein
MAKTKMYSVEDNIAYHETNLAELIEWRNGLMVRAANGENIVPGCFEKVDKDIAYTENMIHDLRTKGRAYD